jgi:hypothetical protein
MKQNGKNQKVELEKKDVKDQTLEELWFRLNLVKSALKLLRNDPDMKDDPRQPKALEIYQGQAKTLRDEIKRRDNSQSTINLKTAKLSARINK